MDLCDSLKQISRSTDFYFVYRDALFPSIYSVSSLHDVDYEGDLAKITLFTIHVIVGRCLHGIPKCVAFDTEWSWILCLDQVA